MDQACVNELGAQQKDYFLFPASGQSLSDYLNDGIIDYQFIESLKFSAGKFFILLTWKVGVHYPLLVITFFISPFFIEAFNGVYDPELNLPFEDSQLAANIPPSKSLTLSGSTAGHYDLNMAYGSAHHSPPPGTDFIGHPPSPTLHNYIPECSNTPPQGEVEDEDMGGTSNVAQRGAAGSGDQERLTTWSSNNSHLPLNHTKQRRQFTDAEKGTMKAHRANLHANREVLESDIKEMIARHHKDIEDLALKHGRKPDYIKKIVTNQTCYKTSRNVSLHNAIIHHKNQEVNTSAFVFLPFLWCLPTC